MLDSIEMTDEAERFQGSADLVGGLGRQLVQVQALRFQRFDEVAWRAGEAIQRRDAAGGEDGLITA